MQFREICEKFLEDKELEGCAKGTLREYRSRLEELGDYFNQEKLNFLTLENTDISTFVHFLIKKGQKNQTIKNKLSTFSVLINWSVKEGLRENLDVKQHYPKVVVQKISRLSDEEIKIFTSYIDGLQENIRAAFYLMMGTGCRVGEAAHLRPTDVTLRGKSVYIDIHEAKWGSDRCIPITEQVPAQVVWKYREELELDSRPLFRVSKRTLQWYATDFAKKTGIPFKCHLLRHTYAALLTEKGVPMTTTQVLLGHKSLSMTAHYANSAIADLKDISATI
ncbi:tyrosine-type recombinase/integrase (plasmid) [Lactobacillus sp. PV037]|uniref:tyrosine-type recombinase/integrase n=1 Tax=unclassified Lactobacillus TaxID=2620435 RepID=UPI00223F9FF0|nr:MULTISPECIES: tyrosine-type recombinase/integrase [unclassified Lactobacillus]QNQ82922.1 tyrosine-type recombinase/integrase [Lactobacillus sp. PV012]QNQ83026.1 tyrosine-type recombinase/integrase [Lactobacillus sp. PV037]